MDWLGSFGDEMASQSNLHSASSVWFALNPVACRLAVGGAGLRFVVHAVAATVAQIVTLRWAQRGVAIAAARGLRRLRRCRRLSAPFGRRRWRWLHCGGSFAPAATDGRCAPRFGRSREARLVVELLQLFGQLKVAALLQNAIAIVLVQSDVAHHLLLGFGAVLHAVRGRRCRRCGAVAGRCAGGGNGRSGSGCSGLSCVGLGRRCGPVQFGCDGREQLLLQQGGGLGHQTEGGQAQLLRGLRFEFAAEWRTDADCEYNGLVMKKSKACISTRVRELDRNWHFIKCTVDKINVYWK